MSSSMHCQWCSLTCTWLFVLHADRQRWHRRSCASSFVLVLPKIGWQCWQRVDCGVRWSFRWLFVGLQIHKCNIWSEMLTLEVVPAHQDWLNHSLLQSWCRTADVWLHDPSLHSQWIHWNLLIFLVSISKAMRAFDMHAGLHARHN